VDETENKVNAAASSNGSRDAGPVTPRAGAQGSQEWFRPAFDDFYPLLYAHRDEGEAEQLISALWRRFDLRGPVLDVACGTGRFLHALRARGQKVVGIDLSRALLARAREDRAPSAAGQTQGSATRPDVGPPLLIRADMRSLPVRGSSMQTALLLFTSFGYFAQRPEDQTVLRELARVLAPGGAVVLDFLNAVTAVGNLVPESRREVAGREVEETRWVDRTGPFLRKRVRVAAAAAGMPDIVYEERVRLYAAGELVAMLERAGLGVSAVLGDYEGHPFSETDSPRCLLVGLRRGGAEEAA
jgi:SAM-dependent methyltransferase